ncbi:hypothetical protein J7L84_01085 [Candidatus Bipolaricaulota bacterium]|nr:hypothetical protein [Candidatus Bipolaricaulota bacterium]
MAPKGVLGVKFGPVLALLGTLSLCSILGMATEIVDVRWEPDIGVIHILLDSWPGVWDGWRFYLNGVEIPMEGSFGKPVIRPDAPLSQPPTGLFVGSLPWLSGLEKVDFPCCGTIRLYIPGEGYTNEFHYNLADLGCRTAAEVECPREWTVHEGDLVIREGEVHTIEGKKFFQKGNVYVREGATLVIRDTEFMMARGGVPTVHVYFFVEPGAKLIIEKSTIRHYPGGTEAGLICVMNRGEVRIADSDTEIHYLDMSDGASLEMVNSTMVNPIGGLLQVTGGKTYVVDSTIGALGLYVPAGAHLTASGLHSGMYFERWDVHQLIPEADYELVLERTTLLKDELKGEYRHGPYERGWIFFLDPDSHVRLEKCELRKVFLEIRDERAEFHDLKVGTPSSLEYRDIVLEGVTVMGQWPFEIHNSHVTIYDSNYLFLQPSGYSIVELVRSHMVEFIPRNFFGTMIFEDSSWTEAGEIIGGVPYHSEANSFSMRGSLRIEGLRENLQWKDAWVRREFELFLVDERGRPVQGAEVRVRGRSYHTDSRGHAAFWITFNEENYAEPTEVEVRLHGKLLARTTLDFFSPSPIELRVTSPPF